MGDWLLDERSDETTPEQGEEHDDHDARCDALREEHDAGARW